MIKMEIFGKKIDELITFSAYRMSLKARQLVQKTLRDNGLEFTTEQWFILIMAYLNEGISQAEIGEMLCKQGPNITRMADELEKKGFIKRLQDKNDRRKYNVFPTEICKETVETFQPRAFEMYEQIIKDIDEEELKVAVKILHKAYGNIVSTLNS